jgi:hypothetical protein
VVVGAVASLFAIGLASCGSADSDDSASSDKAGPRTAGCPGWPEFSAYYAGPAFGGLDVSAVEQTCGGSRGYGLEEDAAIGAFISYGYGDCDPGDAEGCTLPMEIQSRPLCDRQAPLQPGRLRRLTVRGAPALRSSDGSIEVYAGNTAISLAGDDPALLKRAAEALRRPPKSHLPPRGGELTELPEGGPEPRLTRLPRPPRGDLRKREECLFEGKPIPLPGD